MRLLINMFIGICNILMALIIPFSIDIAWNLIKKAGGKGWKVFVPFYSVYEQYRLYYKPALFPLWLILFAADVACFLMPPSILLARIVLISSTGIFVLNLLWSISCAKKFSKKWWFGVGLCLLYPVFGAILTWSDKNRYDPEMFLKDHPGGWICKCGQVNQKENTACVDCEKKTGSNKKNNKRG